MQKSVSSKYILCVLIIFAITCKQPYEPPAVNSNKNYLVVDGVINGGNDSTFITLTRTRNLVDTVSRIPELNAQVSVEGETSGVTPLYELGNGIYSIDHINIINNEKYRLKISTSNGREYASDYVAFKKTPAVDSVSWKQDVNTGVTISMNTHDPQNNTIYYRWDYTETWKYRSINDSELDWVNGQLVFRDTANHLYFCYQSDNSTNVLLGSSSKLAQDIISEAPIVFIEKGAEKLSLDYSIKVNQYALTEEAYNYWTNLKKNTQQLGTLFDAQPSEVNGNIHCLNDVNEPVIGYVSVSTKESQRIYIDNLALDHWLYQPYYLLYKCDVKLVPTDDSMNYWFTGPGPYPYVLWKRPIPPIGYLLYPSQCADCRLHGGTIVKPSFWH